MSKRKQQSIETFFKKKKKEEPCALSEEPIRFVDLFCGIGGFHIAMQKFNSRCVWACDIDPDCQKVYKENFGVEPFGDICKVNVEDIPDHDILFAGFPCQPFSIAGKQKTFTDERTKPYEYILKILKEKKPNTFVLENVKHLKAVADGEALKRIKADLIELGYNIETCMLNTYDFGLPQNRERLFIIGNTRKKFIPAQRVCRVERITLSSILGKADEYIDDSRYTLLDDDQITPQPKSGLIFCGYLNAKLRKAGIRPNTEHLSRVHKQPNRIYHINGTNPTLSSSETSCRYYIYDGKGVRKLKVGDLYGLMGFPKDFKRHSRDTAAIRHIGNAVCPLVVESVISELIQQNLINKF
jgi:DNA (cytosine-5)-methyltransferase 1